MSGQGSRITAATGGSLVNVPQPDLTAEGLLAAMFESLRQVRVTLLPSPEVAPFVTAIVPLFYDVTIPAGTGAPCSENASEFEGKLTVCFDGAPAEGSFSRVTLLQPACNSQCLLVAGLEALDVQVSGSLPGPADHLYVLPLLLLPVTMEDIPALPIPDDSALLGVSVFTQIYLHNPHDFPGDPMKMSNAVEFVIGQGSNIYGAASGMAQWAAQPAVPGGAIQVGFSIDGFGDEAEHSGRWPRTAVPGPPQALPGVSSPRIR